MEALEAALKILERAKQTLRLPEPLLWIAKAEALIRAYHHHYNSAEFKPLHIEKVLTSPIVNPETTRAARKYSAAGKLDVVADLNGRTTLVDHKTTSQDIANPDSPYWRQLIIDNQATHYTLLAWLNGINIEDIVWDVIRKPDISPKAISKKDAERVLNQRLYCSYPVTQQDINELKETGRENHHLYSLRLQYDCTFARPQHYFQRRSVPRLAAEILEYARELWQHSKDLLYERKKELPIRNPGACLFYGRPCEFLEICSGYDAPDSDRWRKKLCVHTELDKFGGDGRDVITFSRVRCFQSCRRKEYYKYELGIERNKASDDEPLVFGRLLHQALEAWWTNQNETGEKQNARNSNTAIQPF